MAKKAGRPGTTHMRFDEYRCPACGAASWFARLDEETACLRCGEATARTGSATSVPKEWDDAQFAAHVLTAQGFPKVSDHVVKRRVAAAE